ncbi:hypothetical protein FD23_GL000832 [Lactobacillus delbrueckii subsp. delbrueckii DSM 20074 = JCM 1012]|nr:hypothetical protein FD23_GL000832 [Lactobacillus delbrueckii subsp. delbrueckii DSM 20074 = JCM 1012]
MALLPAFFLQFFPLKKKIPLYLNKPGQGRSTFLAFFEFFR